MNADVFIDTNVLLYTIDEDPGSASKRQRAQQLLLSERWGWSVQVAAEFFVNATSAKRPFKLSAADAAALVESWLGRRHSRGGQANGLSHSLQRGLERRARLQRRDGHESICRQPGAIRCQHCAMDEWQAVLQRLQPTHQLCVRGVDSGPLPPGRILFQNSTVTILEMRPTENWSDDDYNEPDFRK